MATKKITELVEITAAANDDVLPIVDISTDITNKIKVENLPISTSVQTALNGKEDLTNKSTSVTTDQASNTKYPSVKAVYDWAVGLFATLSQLATKQDTLVSGTNIKTVNSTSLLGSGDISISANPSGVAGSIQFSDGSAFASDSNLFWDNTNKRLGVGTNAPAYPLQVSKTGLGHISFIGSLFNGTRYDGIEIGSTTGGVGFLQSVSGTAQPNPQPYDMYIQPRGGGVGIGMSALSPTARLQVRGSGATSATNALLVQNSAGTNNAIFRDNGELSLILDRTGKGLQLIDNIAPTQSSSYYQRAGVAEVSTNASVLNYFWWANNNGTFPNGVFAYNNGIFIVSSTQKNLNTASSPSAVLQADSTNRGFLPPRMTTTEKNAISSPASGLQVYDTTLNQMSYYNGSSWINF
jgi:hypothetical protein